MGNINPKISVIIPVYKAEKYLRRCVDSLLAQTLQDFEILLIDDGSPDRSGEICDDYVKRDSRIKVLHKINGGVGSARQSGIEQAVGEYTIHVDPDDWVEPTMFEDLYQIAHNKQVDMVICDYYSEEAPGKSVYVKQMPMSLSCHEIQNELFQRLHGSLCNKLVRRACYTRGNVRIPDGLNISEDLWVCLCLLEVVNKVAYLSKAYYHYDRYSNVNSLSKGCTIPNYWQHVWLQTLLKEKGFHRKCMKGYNTRWVSIAYEAFYLNIYSSSEYQRVFFKDINRLFYCCASLRVRLIVFFSSIGLHRILQSIYHLFKNIRF